MRQIKALKNNEVKRRGKNILLILSAYNTRKIDKYKA